jgi:hypothetical protein
LGGRDPARQRRCIAARPVGNAFTQKRTDTVTGGSDLYGLGTLTLGDFKSRVSASAHKPATSSRWENRRAT